MSSTLTYLLLIQALASTTMERLPRPRSFTVSVACRPASIFGGGFFRSASQANLNNQVEKININDSRENINSNHHHPPPTTNSSNSIRISINMTTNSSNSICISINMTSQRPRPSNHHQHETT